MSQGERLRLFEQINQQLIDDPDASPAAFDDLADIFDALATGDLTLQQVREMYQMSAKSTSDVLRVIWDAGSHCCAIDADVALRIEEQGLVTMHASRYQRKSAATLRVSLTLAGLTRVAPSVECVDQCIVCDGTGEIEVSNGWCENHIDCSVCDGTGDCPCLSADTNYHRQE